MKLSGSFIASSLLGLASAAAGSSSSGRVYVLDPHQPSPPLEHGAQPSDILSPETARLVFAQRLGLSQYHSLKNVDEASLRKVNVFGGRRPKLFGDEQLEDETTHVMIVVEGAKDTEIHSPQPMSSFILDNAPNAEANSRLLKDLAFQHEHLSQHPEISSFDALAPVADALNALSEDYQVTNKNGLVLVHLKNLLKAKTEDYLAQAERLSVAVSRVMDLCKEQAYPFTLAMMPDGHGQHTHQKRSVNPWGEYELPKRQAERKVSETILSESTPDSFLQETNTTSSNAEAPISHVDAATPLKGILPACFASKSACESSTNNCTGHGHCYKKYTDPDRDNLACYTCKCSASVRKNRDGTEKTTYYGGPACQKKDVVVPFWLFTGFAVGMAFLLSYGIGLLYSMGNEELPSVIGAGVSGPQARH
ncbi:hypothetical protein K490DRAFT_46276 [Saccharata proteae CBS 121410]|uniref:DUF3844 domain-containing protein n=1 Tax=Saccharata proteae CBS 121410 TaxID=1314787 RepID=A0A9P4HS58_9PEZI|nr:hypothetical protein K490DRAFT_46276 [Saccharata proteae CBS 121410]